MQINPVQVPDEVQVNGACVQRFLQAPVEAVDVGSMEPILFQRQPFAPLDDLLKRLDNFFSGIGHEIFANQVPGLFQLAGDEQQGHFLLHLLVG